MSHAKKRRALLIMAVLVLLSFVAYSLVWSWEFAVLLIGALMLHEYGHIWAMKRCGVPTSGIYLIPFIGGAAIASDKMPSRNADVFMSLMGPVFGFALALATMLVYVWTGWTVLAAATVWMGILNLFNLVPVYPLDGGRVLKCIAYSVPPLLGIGLMGVSVLAACWLFFVTGSFLILLIVFFAFQALRDYVSRPQRKRDCEYLADVREAIEEESLSYTRRVAIACLLGVMETDDVPPSEHALLSLIKVREISLRELPSLTARGIFFSGLWWLLLIGAYGMLLWHALTVPGVLESSKILVGGP